MSVWWLASGLLVCFGAMQETVPPIVSVLVIRKVEPTGSAQNP